MSKVPGKGFGVRDTPRRRRKPADLERKSNGSPDDGRNEGPDGDRKKRVWTEYSKRDHYDNDEHAIIIQSINILKITY